MKLHITANKLAEFILKNPEQRLRLVRKLYREHARKKTDYPQYYMLLRSPAKRYLTGDASDPGELLRLLEKLVTRNETPWLTRDSKLTSEAVKSLLKLSAEIRALPATFLPTGKGTKAVLEYPDIDVIVTPDLIAHGSRNGKPLVGALRFYIAKERQFELGVRGAELVATMEHQWLTRTSDGKRIPDAVLCMVVECFQQRITKAPEDFGRHLKAIEDGCRAFSRMWHGMDGKEAA